MRLMRYVLVLTIAMFASNIYSQQNQNSIMTNQEIVKKFLNGFNNPALI